MDSTLLPILIEMNKNILSLMEKLNSIQPVINNYYVSDDSILITGDVMIGDYYFDDHKDIQMRGHGNDGFKKDQISDSNNNDSNNRNVDSFNENLNDLKRYISSLPPCDKSEVSTVIVDHQRSTNMNKHKQLLFPVCLYNSSSFYVDRSYLDQPNIRNVCKYSFTHYASRDDFPKRKMYPLYALILVDLLHLAVRFKQRITVHDFFSSIRIRKYNYPHDYKLLIESLHIPIDPASIPIIIQHVINTFRSSLSPSHMQNVYINFLEPSDLSSHAQYTSTLEFVLSVHHSHEYPTLPPLANPSTLLHLI